MFDIGFWELAIIGVVALLVVGPEEFPGLVRNAMATIGKLRRFASSVKSELEHEVNKAEELKKLVAEEARIAEMHEVMEEVNGPVAVPRSTTSSPAEPKDTDTDANKGTAQEVAKPHSGGPHHGSD